MLPLHDSVNLSFRSSAALSPFISAGIASTGSIAFILEPALSLVSITNAEAARLAPFPSPFSACRASAHAASLLSSRSI